MGNEHHMLIAFTFVLSLSIINILNRSFVQYLKNICFSYEFFTDDLKICEKEDYFVTVLNLNPPEIMRAG